MKESVRARLARLAKWGALGSLGIILAAIAVHFVLRKPASVKVPEAPAASSPSAGQAVDRKEGIEHVLFRGDTGKTRIKADKFYVGEDKLNHLEGNVEVVDYGRKGGREIRINADRVDYNPEMTRFLALGRAVVRDADSVIESESLSYEKRGGVFRTDRGVTFTSSRLKGRGRSFVYRKNNEVLEINGEISVELLPKDDSGLPLTITGDSFVFRRKAKSGRIEGGVGLAHGRSQGTADALSFLLTHDEQEVRGITLMGNAKIKAYRSAPNGREEISQDIEAGEIWIATYPTDRTISRLTTKRGSVLRGSLSAGSADEIIADSATLTFDRKGGLTTLLATKAVRMRIGSGKEEEQRISGERVIYRRKDGFLRAVGTEKAPARIDTARSEIEALTVKVNRNSEDMEALKTVKLLLKPGNAGESVGFFSGDKPVFVTCGTLSYTQAKKLFVFKEDVRIWQDKDVVLAREFEIQEDSGRVSGRSGVTAGFTQAPKKGRPEERLTITADAMAYDPASKTIAFSGGCTLVSPRIHLTSSSLDIGLKEDGREMERLTARGKVLIVQDGKEGRGGEAVYGLETETVVLTGNPVLVDKDKGVTEGDKLTFDLANDKILIENKEKDRSATVIKS